MLDRMLLAAGGEEKLYVEDVFSTYLYTGNGSSQTITNEIDLAGKGGMVWIKGRSGPTDHALYDTYRGATFDIASNTNIAQSTQSTGLTAFNSNGFSIGSLAKLNTSSSTYASWTFRKAANFFDVVTWTGNAVTNGRQISHNLGAAPGCIIVKAVTGSSVDWRVYHRSASSGTLILNSTAASSTFLASSFFGNGTTVVAPTSTSFTVGSNLNQNNIVYVAYLFAHDTTTDGIIQCGSFTTDSGGLASVNLGWEPQWVMVKSSNAAGSWQMMDTMRGWHNDSVSANDARLWANLTNVEQTTSQLGNPTATGFDIAGQAASTSFVYIAIRRGPMKTPTVGTSVFNPSTSAGSAGTVITTGFPVDMQLIAGRTTTANKLAQDRLRGVSSTTTESAALLYTNLTNAENVAGGARAWDNTGFQLASTGWAGSSAVYWSFRRAPGFFDVVCYTGTASSGTGTWNHNLGVVPELIIYKSRSSAIGWYVYAASVGVGSYLTLNSNNATASFSLTNNRTPTSTVFYTTASDGSNNGSGTNYVAYLFASCPGVSKVGSYTGNGSSQTINCGFSNGARFFLVKRTDSTGDWWVWDSARGIVSAADPALRLNSTAAEVTSADAVDPDSTGIIVNQETTCNINVNGATYIYLAIA